MKFFKHRAVGLLVAGALLMGGAVTLTFGGAATQALAAPASTMKAAASTQDFADVPPTHKFAKEINWMYATGLSTGYSDGSYRPKDGLSREAMAAFLYRQAGSPSYKTPKSFKDVPKSHKFYKPINWMRAAGLSTGYSDGTYRPKDGLSREAMAAFLYRQAGSPKTGGKLFTDVPASYKFADAIRWMRASGITTGYSDGTYRPKDGVSREAMAAFLYRSAGSPAYIDAGSVAFNTSPTVNKAITATPNGWTPSNVKYSYQWTIAGRNIPGATRASYSPVAADEGKSLQVRVTGSLSGASSVTVTGNAGNVQGVPKPPATITGSKPVISGNPESSGKLTYNIGSWSVKPQVTWYMSDASMPGYWMEVWDDGSGSLLVEAEAGTKYKVVATAARSGYKTLTLESAVVTIKPMDTRLVEQEIFRLVNEYRVQNGRKALVWDNRLADGARTWSVHLNTTGLFEHSTPEWRNQYASTVNKTGENIDRMSGSGGTSTAVDAAQNAFDSWIFSPGHRQNILTPAYTATGIGVDVRKSPDGKYWYTMSNQIFEIR